SRSVASRFASLASVLSMMFTRTSAGADYTATARWHHRRPSLARYSRMSLRMLGGTLAAVRLGAPPALACKGDTTVFADAHRLRAPCPPLLACASICGNSCRPRGPGVSPVRSRFWAMVVAQMRGIGGAVGAVTRTGSLTRRFGVLTLVLCCLALIVR